MQKAAVIIVSPSYIIRKGISLIIRKYENILVYDEIDKIEDLDFTSPHNVPDFLIIDNTGHSIIDNGFLINYIEKSGAEIILVSENDKKNNLPVKFNINLYGSEESVKQKFKLLSNLGKNDSLENKKEDILSEREKDVLRLVAKGSLNKEIAEKLFISMHTVITHRKNITRKLGIKTVSGLTVYAILNNLIDLKDVEQ